MQGSRKLSAYNAKRDFSRTTEPRGKTARARKHNLQFLVQKHAARRLHYDLRLEWEGVLWSWAVTRGPSSFPGEKRLAVRTEDHPLSYADFEGVIQKGEYGGGTVMLWDSGIWEPLHDPASGIHEGKLHFRLAGERMKGGWTLVRMRDSGNGKRENWLLIKERDEDASDDPDELVSRYNVSVASGRNMEDIRRAAPAPNISLRENPAFHQPQLATLVSQAPEGDHWLHETKFDGYRCLISFGKSGPRLYTRSGLDWTERFQYLLPSMQELPCRSALMDGEVVSGSGGTSAFSALQHDLKTGGPLLYYAFDLLFLDGKDLRKLPLQERKLHLHKLLAAVPENQPLRYSTHIVGHGPEIFRKICHSGGEGIISKRIDSIYRSSRSRDWLKIKCSRRQEFVVGGFSPSSKPGRPFASLLVGSFEQGELRYRGRVGSGFSMEEMKDLASIFKRLKRDTSPFVSHPNNLDAHWLQPQIVIEVDFAELTTDGYVRHGVYLGRREDKVAASVSDEKPKVSPHIKDRVIDGITITHGDREIFPAAEITKHDLASFYHAAGERLLKVSGERPLSLMRCPRGIPGQCFFQKHAGKGFPDQLKQVTIKESSGKTQPYLYIDSKAGFVAATQMGSIEFHIWGCRVDNLERPDRLVFDLDPDEALTFKEIRGAALTLKALLSDLGLESVPVLSGGKGIHVCVVLKRLSSWDTVKIFSRTVAEFLAQTEPKRFTANMSKAQRSGRIFIDWLRNERGATAIAPYSVRARPGAAVSTPLEWAELGTVNSANAFHISDILQRLEQPCPYLNALQSPQLLGKEVISALEDQLQPNK